MLFEVALIEKPTTKEAQDGAIEKLIMQPFAVVAKDKQAASVLAVLQNKDKITCDMSKLEVLVRPFV